MQVHIEELVFHGVSASDAGRVSEVVQRELALLLSDPTSPAIPPGGDQAVVRAPAFINTIGRSDLLGIQIAKAVHSVWKR